MLIGSPFSSCPLRFCLHFHWLTLAMRFSCGTELWSLLHVVLITCLAMLLASLLSLYGDVKTVGPDAFHAMKVFVEQMILMNPGALRQRVSKELASL
jgi:hypothetical protein